MTITPHTFVRSLVASLVLVLVYSGCGSSSDAVLPVMDAGTNDSPIVEFAIFQLNDVYEIEPVSGKGGMARVGTLLKELKSETPNTISVIAGDFLSPSALGTARVDGERLAGKQMIGALNAIGLDYATFGNHEFDIDEDALRDRISQSNFKWTSANVTNSAGNVYEGTSTREVVSFAAPNGGECKVGIFSVTIDSNRDYAHFSDPLQTSRGVVEALSREADVIVALTHLAVDEDQVLAESIPEIDIIIGGHEHENLQLRRGADDTPIFKADANAKSVYIHRFSCDTSAKKHSLTSEFVVVDDSVPEDPMVKKTVDMWVETGYRGFRESGFDPGAKIVDLTIPLDGMESSVRTRPTALTRLIADAMMRDGNADMGVFNGGSIRVDDILPVGPISQYDVIRVLPFGGKNLVAEMSGELIQQALEVGQQLIGSGGFLQMSSNVTRNEEGGWLIDDVPLDGNRTYTVAINDYLAGGNEKGLEFVNINTDEGHIVLKEERGDIRMAVIKELNRRFE